MKNKKLFITIQIFMLIAILILPEILAEKQLYLLEETNSSRIFKFNTITEIKIDNDFNKPVPLNSSHTVNLTISFKFELPQFFPKLLLGTKLGNWIIFRDINHNMTINLNLNLEKIPDWCEAELESKTITIENITTEAKTKKTKLNIKIKNNAPALEKEIIELSAKFESKSNWGLTLSEDKINFTILSEYNGLIKAEFNLPKNTTELFITPNKNMTFIPVNITNIGNGESIITITIKEIQKNWNLSINKPEITLSPGTADKIYVNITTPKNKERQSMNLTLEIASKSTSKADIDEKYLQGITLELSGLELIKEDTTENVDFTIIIIGLIVMLISLIIVIFFKKKK